MPWFKRFSDPIILRDGRELHTLRDAATYIGEFSTTEQASAEWQIATEALRPATEAGAPTLLARKAVLNVIRRHRPQAAPALRPTAQILCVFGR